MDLLLPDMTGDGDTNGRNDDWNADIRHAPLLSEDILLEAHKDILPQYGFLGVNQKSKIFVNTNIPFSAFICGVQGSGKSHTTACLMENALIPSPHLGQLQNPLSALVFSYSPFSGDGADFNISEAAFLSAANPAFRTQTHAKKVTVLVSPSNPRISLPYRRKVPNVTVLPSKIKPRNLDIETMLTLMAVNDSDEIPLYLAEVTKILRELARKGGSGLDYTLFKRMLQKCRFNPAQKNMLKLRLDLLESFLDLNGSCPEPLYSPGEITIMDMSCPFVDANTACILFKIGLQRYLHSETAGKMVVLDEAHKYMLKVPSAKALNERLHTIIRMQRHYGARVIISTQEPTLLTDLIALCSITVVHRFSSPEWFAALQKHIPIAGFERGESLKNIEALRTGTALVYSGNAVLGKNEDGSLVKGVGKMLRVSVRKSVTADGGISVTAV
ncbi:hypothetical protein K491DRAFT_611390 [Lophiostoma macrostomum CBS 122681]|uniref:P-loop containing nucleoside triphosphate hydrolase protein n=1 Tax=Lophiostoma macrostomum CBS 122681 TaxID=1314788 RepID=A0A6A6SN90_9PLEO|nr:hypothetical protein K491DRAFT_611390 [Lophiostoma macrostomum CBS 122681]